MSEPWDRERGYFMMYLGRLSAMNEALLMRATAIDAEEDPVKAKQSLVELEEVCKKYVVTASSLHGAASLWTRTPKESKV